MNPTEFSHRVLTWFDTHGRKNLPWQHHPTPYRVWVSEIMLQQTQAATVIPYYQRFMAQFPTLGSLAKAELDAVLQLWAGLGYYARARHLHQAAQIICQQYGGEMPLDLVRLQQLPGIGRSTAGAILALAGQQRQPILDGNVKRLLARFAAVTGCPGRSATQTALWRLAETYTPELRVADYTQAMMDLGALVCTPRRPNCRACPLAQGCIAHAQGCETAFPMPRPRRSLPVRAVRMLLLRTGAGAVLLERRPPVGIWGGLWSLPECPVEMDVVDWCQQVLHFSVEIESWFDILRHTFSHFHLDIHPVSARVLELNYIVMEDGRYGWYAPCPSNDYALAAPVKRLLAMLTSSDLTRNL